LKRWKRTISRPQINCSTFSAWSKAPEGAGWSNAGAQLGLDHLDVFQQTGFPDGAFGQLCLHRHLTRVVHQHQGVDGLAAFGGPEVHVPGVAIGGSDLRLRSLIVLQKKGPSSGPSFIQLRAVPALPRLGGFQRCAVPSIPCVAGPALPSPRSVREGGQQCVP
jgi:hypothetical protein